MWRPSPFCRLKFRFEKTNRRSYPFPLSFSVRHTHSRVSKTTSSRYLTWFFSLDRLIVQTYTIIIPSYDRPELTLTCDVLPHEDTHNPPSFTRYIFFNSKLSSPTYLISLLLDICETGCSFVNIVKFVLGFNSNLGTSYVRTGVLITVLISTRKASVHK